MIRSLFNFYIRSSIHVSLATASLAAVTLLEFGYRLNLQVLLFIFLGTVVGYNFVKYAGVANLHHLRNTSNLLLIRVFSILCLAVLLYLCFVVLLPAVIASAAFGTLTILYAFPFYNGRNLRSLKGLKIFVIALVWAGSTVIVPLAAKPFFSLGEVGPEFISRFIFVVALTLPFEIRDMKYDAAELGTLPQILGIRKTRWLGLGFLAVMLIIMLFEQGTSLTSKFITIVITVVTALFLINAKTDQGKYYSAFWVEGIPILWFLLSYWTKLL